MLCMRLVHIYAQAFAVFSALEPNEAKHVSLLVAVQYKCTYFQHVMVCAL